MLLGSTTPRPQPHGPMLSGPGLQKRLCQLGLLGEGGGPGLPVVGTKLFEFANHSTILQARILLSCRFSEHCMPLSTVLTRWFPLTA